MFLIYLRVGKEFSRETAPKHQIRGNDLVKVNSAMLQ